MNIRVFLIKFENKNKHGSKNESQWACIAHMFSPPKVFKGGWYIKL